MPVLLMPLLEALKLPAMVSVPVDDPLVLELSCPAWLETVELSEYWPLAKVPAAELLRFPVPLPLWLKVTYPEIDWSEVCVCE